MKIKIKEIEQKHYNFIISNWLTQYRFNSFPPTPEYNSYFDYHQRIIKKHLYGLTAVNADDEDQFIGFACGNKEVVHFIFVKQLFRRLGIAKKLYHALGSPKKFTHVTKTCYDILKNHQELVFDPYLFYLAISHEEKIK